MIPIRGITFLLAILHTVNCNYRGPFFPPWHPIPTSDSDSMESGESAPPVSPRFEHKKKSSPRQYFPYQPIPQFGRNSEKVSEMSDRQYFPYQPIPQFGKKKEMVSEELSNRQYFPYKPIPPFGRNGEMLLKDSIRQYFPYRPIPPFGRNVEKVSEESNSIPHLGRKKEMVSETKQYFPYQPIPPFGRRKETMIEESKSVCCIFTKAVHRVTTLKWDAQKHIF